MYKLLLILKYLRRKLAPLFAMLAVTLCTAMVIIVISVMGGFLGMMREAAKKLTGDVIVAGDIRGFAHYEELIARIEGLPEAAAATPLVKGYGLVNIRGGVFPVEALGVEPEGLDRVIGFEQALYWDSATFTTAIEREFDRLGLTPDEVARDIEADRIPPGNLIWTLYHTWAQLRKHELKDMGMSMRPPEGWASAAGEAARDEPGIVPGIHVTPQMSRDSDGAYEPMNSILTGLYLGGREVTLTVLGVDEAGMPTNPETRRLAAVNEFKSGLYEVDANQVFVPFEVAQEMLEMQPAPEVDFETGELTGRTIPGRTHEVMVRGEEGVSLEALEAAVIEAVDAWREKNPQGAFTSVYTWEQKHATLLNAVKNEKGLITFLFAFISMVAVVMIATTFYMIVLEKTRDIGVLRAIGASRLGIANIFISYGLLLGTIGALAGLALGVTIVHNLNEIQEGLYQLTLWWTDGRWGWRMWDPRTYYFDSIPESVDYRECASIVIGAIVSSVMGATIPAFLAGRLNPVEALRYE